MLRSSVDTNTWCNEFGRIENLFPMEADDKIVDITSGRHMLLVVTEKGKCYATGYVFYRYVS